MPNCRHLLCLLLLIVLPVTMPGCAGRSVFAHTNAYGGTTAQSLAAIEDLKQWKADYEAAPDDRTARHHRNRIIRRLMLMDDERFLLWSQRLYGGKALADSVTDISLSVLTTAAAAANPAKVAETLSLISSALTTTRVVAEKNIFLEKSVGALVSQMESDRAKVDTQITQYLKEKDVAEYPLEQGLRDFLRYYKAGTLAAASESLRSRARVDEETSSAHVERVKGDRQIAPAVLARGKITDVEALNLNDDVVRDIAVVKKRIEDADTRAANRTNPQHSEFRVQAAIDDLAQLELAFQNKHQDLQPADYQRIMEKGGWTPADATEFPPRPTETRKFIRSRKSNDAAITAMKSEMSLIKPQ